MVHLNRAERSRMGLKIYTSTPRAFLPSHLPDSVFFTRDMGLTCHALRARGAESMVVMPDGPSAKKHPDIIRTDLDCMSDADWWRAHELDGVVLGSWALPRFTPVARAIKESGAKLILRCDSGSPYSQWQSTPWEVLYRNYLVPRYRGKSAPHALVQSMIRTVVGYHPGYLVRKVVEHMTYADVILNETPLGVRALRNLLYRYGGGELAGRVVYAPHPVNCGKTSRATYAKKRKIIAVGRWNSYQKNTPLLMRSLLRVLAEHPKYEAHLFGAGEEACRNGLRGADSQVADRIHIRGIVSNEALQPEYASSQIFFAPSRSESFNIAAAEALCEGCSVVGSAHIFSFQHFVSRNSGTLTQRYSVQGMVQALNTEISAWGKSVRDPVAIASAWHAECAASKVAAQIESYVAHSKQID